MKQNIGTLDRLLRIVGGLGLLTCSLFAPLPLAVRAAGLAPVGVYLLLTSVFGACLGYSLLGRSTCAVRAKQ